jgi:hypothetical protein
VKSPLSDSDRCRLSLASRAYIARTAEVLDLFDFAAAFRAGPAGGMFIHYPDIPARVIEQVDFIVPAAHPHNLVDRRPDREVQRPDLARVERLERVARVQPGAEEDILRDRIPEPRDQLILGEQPLHAALFPRMTSFTSLEK